MTREELEKAKGLEKQIDEYNRLLTNKQKSYYWCLVKINCANSNGYTDDYGRIPRSVMNRMLDVLIDEREKLINELNAL